ncbi:MAG: hypothetical protein ACRDH0_14415 [Actinomycetota bacterium]
MRVGRITFGLVALLALRWAPPQPRGPTRAVERPPQRDPAALAKFHAELDADGQPHLPRDACRRGRRHGALAFALLLFGTAALRASERRECRHYNRG